MSGRRHNPYPTPRRNRQLPRVYTDIEMDNDIDFDAATRTHLERNQGGVSKATKRFQGKVLKALQGDKVSGEYISSYVTTLSSKTVNQWTVIEQGDRGSLPNFFQPLQFKDAQAIIFNNKVAAECTATAPGAGYGTEVGNLTQLQPVRVLNSSAFFSFKSNSSMKMIVEMYEVQGVTNIASNGTGANFQSYWTSYSNVTLSAGAAGTDITVRPGFATLHSSISQIPALLSDFKVKRTVFKFNPGEEATHFIQGPKNYTMKPETKLKADGTWGNWTSPGNGIHVLFRVIADHNFGYHTGVQPGSTANTNLANQEANIAHFKNTADIVSGCGTVNVEIVRKYKIEEPEGTPTTAFGTNFTPACVYLNYLPTIIDTRLVVQTVVPGAGTAGNDPPRE